MAKTQMETFSGTTQGLLSDIERLLGNRLGNLKDEVVNELGKAATAGASLGGGLGMTALGTILGGVAFTELIHDITGLPRWLCYAGTSAAACCTGAGLVTTGVKKASEMKIIPEGTGQKLRQAVANGA